MPLARVLRPAPDARTPAALLGLKGRGTLTAGSYGDRGDLRPQGGMDLPRHRVIIEGKEYAV